MTDTAELITRLENHDARYYEIAAKVIAVQAQEIERLRSDMTGLSIDRHYSRQEQVERAEAAEARVRELNEDYQRICRGHDQLHDERDEARDECDAIEAKTIERCAQVADRMDSVNGIGAAIRALRLNLAE